ncbi:hypothetical protein LLEC1_00043 [Akanthomyces lecanii]|uniref:DUF6598 domain-containing protein n=1 Tax=Cordyceps confragosa TaxID=2714763 RepID=A0A179I3N6_CORDF|nr:hypothetical protein LLEC1_00043 [Akanthomyces lecanii]
MNHTKILFWWLAFICCSSRAVLSQSPPTVVYRADMLTPEDLKRQGAFFPRGEDQTRPNQPPASLSLYNHVGGTLTGTGRHDSGYVSTTTSLNFARRFVANVLGGRGYIYRIHVSANFIDAQGTLGHFYRHTEEAEVASLGRIHFSQVLGWTEVINNAEQSEVLNPEYDSRFDTASWGGSQPQLGGFPPTHIAWTMDPWRAFASCSSLLNKRDDKLKCSPLKSSQAFAEDFLAHIPEAETQITRPDTTPSENGRELAEVFWVRIDNIDGEKPGDLYGSITATDDQGKQELYKKDRANYDSIQPGEKAFLIGPPRSISAAGGFTIDLSLSDKDSDPSPDDEVSYGKVSWKHGDAHDAVQETKVPGKYGEATVNYVVMSKAAQAQIDIVLINGDKEKPADIYGTILAATKFGQHQLFKKADSEHIDISPGQKFPLERSTMAVPMDGNLAFDVDVWDYDFDPSPNDQVAKENVELIPKIGTSSKKLVNGKYGQVEISVTWS